MSQPETKCWRNDAYAKVTGKAKFTDDLKFANVLHAAPAYSDCVHARIVSIDTSAAEKVSGVVRVLTAKDVPGENRFGQIIRDYRIFADDKIRYHGDVVAIVVAETRAIAIHAAQLVKVNAEPLPAVLDPEAAMLPDAPLVHEHHGSNIVNTHVVRRGNVDDGFKQADFVIEEKFQTQTIEHAYMETEAAVCVPRSTDGVLEVYGSMQHPFSTRRFVAACLGVALSEIEVIGTPMGGGFGGKDDTAAIVCARAALAAKLLGRPVKMVYRRDWSMRESYKRHPYRVHYKMGVTKAGRITAVQCRIVADGGAYCSVTPWVTWRSTVQCCGPYVVENVHCDTFGVYTNNVVAGAMRGFGSPQMNFVIEQMVEIAARRVGISGIEFRRRNMVRQGSITITGQKLDGHKVAMAQALDTVLREIDYEKKLARCSHGQSKPRSSRREEAHTGFLLSTFCFLICFHFATPLSCCSNKMLMRSTVRAMVACVSAIVVKLRFSSRRSSTAKFSRISTAEIRLSIENHRPTSAPASESSCSTFPSVTSGTNRTRRTPLSPTVALITIRAPFLTHCFNIIPAPG